MPCTLPNQSYILPKQPGTLLKEAYTTLLKEPGNMPKEPYITGTLLKSPIQDIGLDYQKSLVLCLKSPVIAKRALYYRFKRFSYSDKRAR